MAKNKFDTKNLEIMTDPNIDQSLRTILGGPNEENAPKEVADSKATKKEPASKKRKTSKGTTPKKQENAMSSPAQDPTNHIRYNYSKQTVDVDGVGTVEKVVSEKGKIIGRPSKPIKEKKKPITLTLTPELYDLVKERATADRRTTSEFLAIIIEEYFKEQ